MSRYLNILIAVRLVFSVTNVGSLGLNSPDPGGLLSSLVWVLEGWLDGGGGQRWWSGGQRWGGGRLVLPMSCSNGCY